MLRRWTIRTLKAARRVIVAVVGLTVVAVGVVLIFTPGPAFVVIPVGLAILATEFVWARRLLQRVRDEVSSAGERFMSRSKREQGHGNDEPAASETSRGDVASSESPVDAGERK